MVKVLGQQTQCLDVNNTSKHATRVLFDIHVMQTQCYIRYTQCSSYFWLQDKPWCTVIDQSRLQIKLWHKTCKCNTVISVWSYAVSSRLITFLASAIQFCVVTCVSTHHMSSFIMHTPASIHSEQDYIIIYFVKPIFPFSSISHIFSASNLLPSTQVFVHVSAAYITALHIAHFMTLFFNSVLNWQQGNSITYQRFSWLAVLCTAYSC